MKTSFELVAESRNHQGKGASRRLRRSSRVPAILYGAHQEARSLSLDHTRLLLLLDNERFYSTILSLDIGGQKQPAVLKDLQRHPYKNQIVHIDFQRVLDNEPIRPHPAALHQRGHLDRRQDPERRGLPPAQRCRGVLPA